MFGSKLACGMCMHEPGETNAAVTVMYGWALCLRHANVVAEKCEAPAYRLKKDPS